MVRLGSLFQGLASPETLDWAADASEKVFKLAETLDKDEIKKLAPIISQGATLLEVLNSPLADLAESTIPFVKVGTGLLKLYLQATKQEPTLEQQVALVSQAAYVESFKVQLLNRPRLKDLLKQVGRRPPSQQVQHYLKHLEDVELKQVEAEQALGQFDQSKLSIAFNQVLVVRLQALGSEPELAEQFAKKVSAETHRYLGSAVAELGDTVKRVRDWYALERETYEKYWSIDEYLDSQIRLQPDELIFDERTINLRDLYVPLEAKLLDRDGNPLEDQSPVDLEAWVSKILNSSEMQHQVLFIQGGAGQGKSVFCRMFGDRLARPGSLSIYTPILIRLRHLRRLANNLTETLETYLETWAFAQEGWLKDRNNRFLFLLDGFDELLLQGQEGGGLKEFLGQVADFQRKSESHRCIVTGRPLALQGVDRLITQEKCLERVQLEPMNDEIRKAWLQKWAAKVGKLEVQQFWQFLQACPKDVKDHLAREPLLLYLLARMHREKRLNTQIFAGAEATQAKIAVYDEVVKWVLDKQRQEENIRLTGLTNIELRQFMTEIALCVVQSGHEFATLSMLKSRLPANQSIAALLKQSGRETEIKKEERVLNNLLTSFYLQPRSDDREGSVEFAHKSFGEFLFAERLKEAMEDWSESGSRRGEPFLVEDKKLWEEIYDLLGYGNLTVELVDYVMGMLQKNNEVEWIPLFQRLKDFYFRWSNGEFIDALSEQVPRFPEQKMRTMRSQLGGLKPDLGLRQVDVFTGLNILILLFSLHRYAQSRDDLKAQIHFNPCRGSGAEGFDDGRLLRAIGYSNCVRVGTFREIVRLFLVYADLSHANLNGADLSDTNLSHANLSHANLNHTELIITNLCAANLSHANLSHAYLGAANLNGADLSNTHLSSAYLTHAYLIGADLSHADLSNAYLSYADLSAADLSHANLSNANLSNANLSHANLSHANLSNVNLRFANLNDADLRNSENLTLERVAEAKLCQTKLPTDIQIDSDKDCVSLREELDQIG